MAILSVWIRGCDSDIGGDGDGVVSGQKSSQPLPWWENRLISRVTVVESPGAKLLITPLVLSILLHPHPTSIGVILDESPVSFSSIILSVHRIVKGPSLLISRTPLKPHSDPTL
ncbi:hypothetical protein Tco_1392290 [Tanacetum coccineum]